MAVREEPARDDPGMVAMMYGPLVLAAASTPIPGAPAIVTDGGSVAGAVRRQPGTGLEFTASAPPFEATGGEAPAAFRLAPFYRRYDTPYIVYWNRFTSAQWREKRKEIEAQLAEQRALEARTVDTFQPGEMQPERDHNFQGEKTSTGEAFSRKWRHAVDGGWFSFDMKGAESVPLDLICTYWGSDGGGREFDILVNGATVATQKLENNRPQVFYDETYPLPEDVTRSGGMLTIRFQARSGKIAGGLYFARLAKRQ